jgi:hypothetical protein
MTKLLRAGFGCALLTGLTGVATFDNVRFWQE